MKKLSNTLFVAVFSAFFAFGGAAKLNAAELCSPDGEDLLIGVAGGYKDSLEEIVDFAQMQGIAVSAIYNHPKSLLTSRCAPAMGYVVGDLEALQAQKDIKIEKFIKIGTGKLVFIARKEGVKIEDISNLKVAVPPLTTSIFGRAIIDFLAHSNLKPKELIQAPNAPRAVIMTKLGDADAAIVNFASAASSSEGEFGTQIILEEGYEGPNIVAARTSVCEDKEICDDFEHFLQSAKAQRILKRYGL